MSKCPFSHELPPAIARLKKDGRGLPIPFTNHIYADGTPDFRVLDPRKVSQCAMHRLCGVCGEKMPDEIVFIGGPLCVEHGYFSDAPMHEMCARYAQIACPYLRGDKDHSASVAPRKEEAGIKFATNDLASNVRPDRMAFIFAGGFAIVRQSGGSLLFKVLSPTKVEWWEGVVKP